MYPLAEQRNEGGWDNGSAGPVKMECHGPAAQLPACNGLSPPRPPQLFDVDVHIALRRSCSFFVPKLQVQHTHSIIAVMCQQTAHV